jgi:hypothetical protein
VLLKPSSAGSRDKMCGIARLSGLATATALPPKADDKRRG